MYIDVYYVIPRYVQDSEKQMEKQLPGDRFSRLATGVMANTVLCVKGFIMLRVNGTQSVSLWSEVFLE